MNVYRCRKPQISRESPQPKLMDSECRNHSLEPLLQWVPLPPAIIRHPCITVALSADLHATQCYNQSVDV